MMDKWQKAQAWERTWWGDCLNTYHEEQKQLVYAGRMGLATCPDAKTPYRFDMQGKSVIDIGGGPCSLLLKCVNVKGKVIDPLRFPRWVKERYRLAGIEFQRVKAEDLSVQEKFDETWCYNTLQHVDSPRVVISKMRKIAEIIRLFEWIDFTPSIGHLWSLGEEQLNGYLHGEGRIEDLDGKEGCKGRAYYGIFIGKKV